MSSIGSKMIISHDQYKDKVYDLSNKKIMVAIIPILRETQEEIDSISPNKIMSDYEYMTYDNFKIFIKELENNGINEIMICCWDRKEKRRIHNLVKEYKEENGFIL
jgi:hypothetical protein